MRAMELSRDAIAKAFAAPWVKQPSVGDCYDAPDPNLWHPNTQSELDIAQDVCRGCPIGEYCYTVGTARKDSGVYGGVLLVNGKPHVMGSRWPKY